MLLTYVEEINSGPDVDWEKFYKERIDEAVAYAKRPWTDEKFGKYLYKKLKENHCYEGNMFIAKKETINNYLNFIFNTLAEFDKNHNFKISRIDGYIAEYMFGPWLEYNGLKIKNQKRKNTSTGKIC